MKWILLLILLLETGCYNAHLPVIANHHWASDPFGATLYTNTGEEAASFISSWGEPTQVCLSEFHEGCRYFETDSQALEWLASKYRYTQIEETKK